MELSDAEQHKCFTVLHLCPARRGLFQIEFGFLVSPTK